MRLSSRSIVSSFAALLACVGSSLPVVAADNDVPTVTAKELTAAYVKNLNAAIKKYGDSMNPRK